MCAKQPLDKTPNSVSLGGEPEATKEDFWWNMKKIDDTRYSHMPNFLRQVRNELVDEKGFLQDGGMAGVLWNSTGIAFEVISPAGSAGSLP